MDSEYEDLLAKIATLSFENASLSSKVVNLENKLVERSAMLEICINTQKQTRIRTREQIEKSKFYKKHRDDAEVQAAAVAENNKNKTAWQHIKKITDKMYIESK
jgi:hypothetical protein